MMSGELDKKIIWTGLVIDNDDPLMLNRVRVSFNTIVDGRNNASILSSIPNIINGKKSKNDDNTDLLDEFKWTKDDPFCFLPLLPLFLKVTPKKGEAVNIIYPNPKIKMNEQYYIQGTFTSPLTIYNENFEASRMFATKDRIIDAKKLKNPTTLQYYNKYTDGVFPEAEDVALIGRGTCDLILKNNDVLIRAGKTSTNPDSPTKELRVNKTRSFIQLSDFTTRIEDLGNRTIYRAALDIQYVKTLVEWSILNPENRQDKFTLEIKAYRLPEKREYTTKNLKIDSVVNPADKTNFISMRWPLLSASANTVSDYVNQFISQFNSGTIKMPPNNDIINVTDNFPFVFRPSPETYKWIKDIKPTKNIQYINVSKIKDRIEFKFEKKGFGLVFSKDRTGVQGYLISESLKQLSYSPIPTTYGILGADRLYLLSHESQIPGKERIQLNDDTVKGLTQDFIIEKVLPNTNSMVRGEELMKLLNLVVNFLLDHSHPFHGIKPIPQAGSVSELQLRTAINEANSTILNQKIRIN